MMPPSAPEQEPFHDSFEDHAEGDDGDDPGKEGFCFQIDLGVEQVVAHREFGAGQDFGGYHGLPGKAGDQTQGRLDVGGNKGQVDIPDFILVADMIHLAHFKGFPAEAFQTGKNVGVDHGVAHEKADEDGDIPGSQPEQGENNHRHHRCGFQDLYRKAQNILDQRNQISGYGCDQPAGKREEDTQKDPDHGGRDIQIKSFGQNQLEQRLEGVNR